MPELSRRELALAALGLAVACAAPDPIEAFLRCSAQLLDREDLDADDAAALHAALVALGGQAALDELAEAAAQAPAEARRSPAGRALVLAWYTGFVGGFDRMVLGPDRCLAWRAVRPTLPPTWCNPGWERAPEGGGT